MMDFLNRNLFLMMMTILLASPLRASPPQDLSVFDKPEAEDSESDAKPARRLRFKEEDVTAGTPPPRSVRDANALGQQKQVRYEVVCREQPGRRGQPRLKLSAATVVVETRRSNQWSQVTTTRGSVGCWVPTSALVVLQSR